MIIKLPPLLCIYDKSFECDFDYECNPYTECLGCGKKPDKMGWYTAAELRDYLVLHNYSPDIARELCEQYAKNLQDAFNKGRSVERNR